MCQAQWAPVLGWLWAWRQLMASAQRWVGVGAGVAPGATEVWMKAREGLNSKSRDRGSELSLASALSAQSRAPSPHRPSREGTWGLGAGLGCREPQRDPLREKGLGPVEWTPPSCHTAGT